MTLTSFEQLFRNTLLTITDNIEDIYAEYLFARTDKVRQEIIDGVISGKLKTMDDVSDLTFEYCPAHKAGLI